MKTMTTFFTILSLFTLPAIAQGLTIDYDFKNPEECGNPNHEEYTDLMMNNQGKLAEIVEGKNTNTFYHSWAEAMEQQYDGNGNDADRIFVFKSYPQAGLMFAYKDGCLLGARVLPLDLVNKIVEIYRQKKKMGDL